MENTESSRFSRKIENFTCEVCGTKVAGSGYTDHCPHCLWSKHVDINPGDRNSNCHGLLEPLRTENTRNGFYIKYRCEKCKVNKKFGAAKDDNQELLFQLSEG
jgi:hypothetical protein